MCRQCKARRGRRRSGHSPNRSGTAARKPRRSGTVPTGSQHTHRPGIGLPRDMRCPRTPPEHRRRHGRLRPSRSGGLHSRWQDTLPQRKWCPARKKSRRRPLGHTRPDRRIPLGDRGHRRRSAGSSCPARTGCPEGTSSPGRRDPGSLCHPRRSRRRHSGLPRMSWRCRCPADRCFPPDRPRHIQHPRLIHRPLRDRE